MIVFRRELPTPKTPAIITDSPSALSPALILQYLPLLYENVTLFRVNLTNFLGNLTSIANAIGISLKFSDFIDFYKLLRKLATENFCMFSFDEFTLHVDSHGTFPSNAFSVNLIIGFLLHLVFFKPPRHRKMLSL